MPKELETDAVGKIEVSLLRPELPTRTEHGRPLKPREAAQLAKAIEEERHSISNAAYAASLLRDAGVVPGEGEPEIVGLALSATLVIAALRGQVAKFEAQIIGLDSMVKSIEARRREDAALANKLEIQSRRERDHALGENADLREQIAQKAKELKIQHQRVADLIAERDLYRDANRRMAEALITDDAGMVQELRTQIEQLQGDNRLLRQQMNRFNQSLHGVSCEVHASWSAGCADCRNVELKARVEELRTQLQELSNSAPVEAVFEFRSHPFAAQFGAMADHPLRDEFLEEMEKEDA